MSDPVVSVQFGPLEINPNKNATKQGRIWWLAARIGALPGVLRGMIVNILILMILATLAIVTWQTAHDTSVLIRPFSVPKTISASGLTGEVLARQLWDDLGTIHARSGSIKSQAVLKSPEQEFDFVEPSSGISLLQFSRAVRRFLGNPQKHIDGALICGLETCGQETLRLRIRYFDGTQAHTIDTFGKDYPNVPNLILGAAEDVMRSMDPYILAVFFNKSDQRRKDALAIVQNMIDTKHADRAWAAHFQGNVKLAQGNYPAALQAYNLANTFAKEDGLATFAWSYHGIGKVFSKIGDAQTATANFKIAVAKDDTFDLAWIDLGNSLSQINQHSEALDSFEKASDLGSKEQVLFWFWSAALLRYITSGAEDKCVAAELRVPAIVKVFGDRKEQSIDMAAAISILNECRR